jgi:hypothetical protein
MGQLAEWYYKKFFVFLDILVFCKNQIIEHAKSSLNPHEIISINSFCLLSLLILI